MIRWNCGVKLTLFVHTRVISNRPLLFITDIRRYYYEINAYNAG